MESTDMLDNLTSYFQGKYNAKQYEELGRMCKRIPENERFTVWEYIRDNNKPNYRIGVSAIVEACRALSVPYRAVNTGTPEYKITCECGLEFTYQQGCGSDRYDERVFDVCPRCGMSPQDMYRAKEEAERGDGRKPKWYWELFSECFRNHCLPGQEPHINRRKDKSWEEENKRDKIKKLKEIIDEEIAFIAKLKNSSCHNVESKGA
jgi:hypothetical protein